MKTNVELIQDLYEYFARREMQAIERLFDENIIWKQMDGFPGGGRYMGFKEIVTNVFSGFSENWTGWKATITEFLDAGDSVLAVGYYEGTFNSSGKHLKADFIHRYQLKNNKVVKFDQYTDTKLVAEAMK